MSGACRCNDHIHNPQACEGSSPGKRWVSVPTISSQLPSSLQALICTALGLPPTFFRRLVQSNGATSVLDFMPARGGGAPSLVVDRLNQVQPCYISVCGYVAGAREHKLPESIAAAAL